MMLPAQFIEITGRWIDLPKNLRVGNVGASVLLEAHVVILFLWCATLFVHGWMP
jgi:hypothetical protein